MTNIDLHSIFIFRYFIPIVHFSPHPNKDVTGMYICSLVTCAPSMETYEVVSYDKGTIKEYDERFNKFTTVLYVVGFKLTVYALVYLLKPLLWTAQKDFL